MAKTSSTPNGSRSDIRSDFVFGFALAMIAIGAVFPFSIAGAISMVTIALLVWFIAAQSSGWRQCFVFLLSAVPLGLAMATIYLLYHELPAAPLTVLRGRIEDVRPSLKNVRTGGARENPQSTKAKQYRRNEPVVQEIFKHEVASSWSMPGSADGSYVIHAKTEARLTVGPRTTIIRDGQRVSLAVRPRDGDLITVQCIRYNAADCEVSTLWLPSPVGYDYPDAAPSTLP